MSTIPPLLLAVAAITAVGVLAVGLVLHRHRLRIWTRRRLDQVLPRPELTRARPFEQLARDLLRVRADLRAIPTGTAMARRRGIIEAYDELLAEACHELELDDSLGDLTRIPFERRQRERAQVEQALGRAGLRLSA